MNTGQGHADYSLGCIKFGGCGTQSSVHSWSGIGHLPAVETIRKRIAHVAQAGFTILGGMRDA